MGGGRAPCCDKTKVKRGAWSPAEDMRLTTFIQNHGHTNWRALPKLAGLLRCGKSCRLRWINYLRSDVKRGNFTREEEQIIINLHNSIGNKWSMIASYLPGRTDNEIKNVWNTYLKKKLKNDNKTKVNDSKPNSSPSTYQFCTSSSLNSKNPLLGGDVERSDSNIVSKDSTSDLSRTSSYASDSPTSSDIMHDFSKTEVICIDDDEKIVIPLESDIDFWELFDSLDENQEPETHVSHQEDDIENEWFKVLENELELDYDMKSLTNDQNDVPKTLEIDLEPEIGLGLDYFPIWPCSPHDLHI